MEPPKIERRRPVNTLTQESVTGFASGHLSHNACPNIVTGKGTQNWIGTENRRDRDIIFDMAQTSTVP